jgi:hypothetical protein
MRLWGKKPIPAPTSKPFPQEDDLLGHELNIAIYQYSYTIGPASNFSPTSDLTAVQFQRPDPKDPGADVVLSWHGLWTPGVEGIQLPVNGDIQFLNRETAEGWEGNPFKAGFASFWEGGPDYDALGLPARLSVTLRVNLAIHDNVLRAFQMGFERPESRRVWLGLELERLADGVLKKYGGGRKWLGIVHYRLNSVGWFPEELFRIVK